MEAQDDEIYVNPFIGDVNEIINGIVSADDGFCVHCGRLQILINGMNPTPNNTYIAKCFNHHMKELLPILRMGRNQRRNV